MYDFIVVGARCAGAATAFFLARHGFRLLVIDRYAAPGPTLSTHIIGETDIYRQLNIDARMKASGIPELTRMRIDLEGRLFESDITVTPRALSVRRELLDRWLLEELRQFPNVDISLRTSCMAVIQSGKPEIGVRIRRAGRGQETVYAKAIIGADGRSSTVARAVDAKTSMRSEAHHLAVYYAYIERMEPLPIPAVEWYWNDGDIVLCNPLDRGLHCIAAMIPQRRFQEWRSCPKAFYLERLRQIRTLAPRMKQAAMSGKLRGIAPMASYIRHPCGDRWALVGDAGAYLHPVSGSGIDNAVCTAEMLANELNLYMKAEKTWKEAMSAYTDRRDERIVPQYDHCLKTLEMATRPLDPPALATLDVLCTFPSLVKELSRRSQHIHSILMEGLHHD